MNRLRGLLAILFFVAFVFAAPMATAQEQPASGDVPAVVVDDGGGDVKDQAWTFRYLVPTLVIASSLALAVVVLGYGVRVRGRYRVTE